MQSLVDFDNPKKSVNKYGVICTQSVYSRICDELNVPILPPAVKGRSSNMEAVQELSAKKKRVRRRMVNGVLIGGTNKQDIDLDNSLKIQDLGEDCQ